MGKTSEFNLKRFKRIIEEIGPMPNKRIDTKGKFN